MILKLLSKIFIFIRTYHIVSFQEGGNLKVQALKQNPFRTTFRIDESEN